MFGSFFKHFRGCLNFLFLFKLYLNLEQNISKNINTYSYHLLSNLSILKTKHKSKRRKIKKDLMHENETYGENIILFFFVLNKISNIVQYNINTIFATIIIHYYCKSLKLLTH